MKTAQLKAIKCLIKCLRWLNGQFSSILLTSVTWLRKLTRYNPSKRRKLAARYKWPWRWSHQGLLNGTSEFRLSSPETPRRVPTGLISSVYGLAAAGRGSLRVVPSSRCTLGTRMQWASFSARLSLNLRINNGAAPYTPPEKRKHLITSQQITLNEVDSHRRLHM